MSTSFPYSENRTSTLDDTGMEGPSGNAWAAPSSSSTRRTRKSSVPTQ